MSECEKQVEKQEQVKDDEEEKVEERPLKKQRTGVQETSEETRKKDKDKEEKKEKKEEEQEEEGEEEEERASIEVFCEASKNGVVSSTAGRPGLFLQAPAAVGEDPAKARAGAAAMKTADLRQTLYWLTGASAVRPRHVRVGSGGRRQCSRRPPAFPTVAIVAVSALPEPLWRAAEGDTRCRVLGRAFGAAAALLRVRAPGSRTLKYNFLDTLLRDGTVLRGLEPRADAGPGGAPETADDLVLSDAAYAAAYPFPAASVCVLGDYTYDIVETRARPAALGPEPPARHVLALDCEMCQTAYGLEVARVSVVDATGALLYDTTVLPTHPVTDHLTRYSGITAEILARTTTTLADVRETLLAQYIFCSTVLVGHGLENDLAKLHIAHRRVVDTAVLYGRLSGGKYKLRELTRHFLHRDIQVEGAPHDSTEDARACLDLVRLRLQNGRAWTVAQLNFNPRNDPPPAWFTSDPKNNNTPSASEQQGQQQQQQGQGQQAIKLQASLFTTLADQGVDCAIFDSAEFVGTFVPPPYEHSAHLACHTVQSDAHAVAGACKLLAAATEQRVPLPRVLWVRLDSLHFRARAIETAQNKHGPGQADRDEERNARAEYATGLAAVDAYVARLYDALPADALVVVLGMDPPARMLAAARRQCTSGQAGDVAWTPALERLLERRTDEARSLFARFVVKRRS